MVYQISRDQKIVENIIMSKYQRIKIKYQNILKGKILN